MIHRRLFIALTASLGLVACGGAKAGRDDAILLAVTWGDSGTTFVEPVAMMPAGGGFAAVSDSNTTADTVRRRWLDDGHAYTVLRGGKAAGMTTVIGGDVEVCSPLQVRTRTAVREPGWRNVGLATSAMIGAQTPLRGTATAGERAAIVPLLRQAIFAHRGTWRDDAEVRADRIALPNGGIALVGSAVVRPDTTSDAGPVYAAFAIAERGAGGAWHPRATWYNGPGKGARQVSPWTRTLVDAVDVDGDGTPEIVARTAFYEAWGYTIYRRGADGWAEAYTGGGGAC